MSITHIHLFLPQSSPSYAIPLVGTPLVPRPLPSTMSLWLICQSGSAAREWPCHGGSDPYRVTSVAAPGEEERGSQWPHSSPHSPWPLQLAPVAGPASKSSLQLWFSGSAKWKMNWIWAMCYPAVTWCHFYFSGWNGPRILAALKL